VQLIDPGPFGFRVIPNLSGKSGTGDRSRERNGTVVKRILTLPCPALHLPEVQHELLDSLDHQWRDPRHLLGHRFLCCSLRLAAAAIRLRLRLLQYFSLYGLQLQQSKQLQQCRLVASRTRSLYSVQTAGALPLCRFIFFAEFQCLPLLSTCSSRALCAAAALKQRGLSRRLGAFLYRPDPSFIRVVTVRPRSPRRSPKSQPRFLWSARASMASPSPAVSSLETEAPQATVTRERRLNPDLQEHLPKPCKHTSRSIPSP
jgi:hypothetical protein